MSLKNQQNNQKSILSVVKYGNPILRKKVHQVINFSTLPGMIEQMFEAMYAEKGIGLAANQIGLSLDLLVLDTSNNEGEGESGSHIFINSKIVWTEGEVVMDEGCLSIPDIRAEIKRPETIKLRYLDLDQNIHERLFSGLTSRVIQHEIDHLNGKLFIDHLPQSKRILINKRLLEISKIGNPSTGLIL